VSADKKKAAILVAINSNNEVWIDKNEVELDEIKIQLLRLRTENPKGGLVIQADNGSNLETLGKVADAALEIGLTDIAVSTLTE
jgi:biopolymer transport protein ExbD